MSEAFLSSLFKPQLQNRCLVDGVISTLPRAERAASYDKLARTYDWVVGNPIYNRIVWGVAPRHYENGARAFLEAAAKGPVIDFGCGSLVFTHRAYAGHASRLVLFDRSLGMLERAAGRLPGSLLVQGDAFDPPFSNGAFVGAMAWGMLHIFGTRSRFLDHLAALVPPGGDVALSTLVKCERRLGNAMLAMLHANGEASEPETATAVVTAFDRLFSVGSRVQYGNMLFLRGAKRA